MRSKLRHVARSLCRSHHFSTFPCFPPPFLLDGVSQRKSRDCPSSLSLGPPAPVKSSSESAGSTNPSPPLRLLTFTALPTALHAFVAQAIFCLFRNRKFKMGYDNLLTKAGDFGLYQILLSSIFVCYTTFLCGLNYYTQVIFPAPVNQKDSLLPNILTRSSSSRLPPIVVRTR